MAPPRKPSRPSPAPIDRLAKRPASRQTTGAESARKVLGLLLQFNAKRPWLSIDALAEAVGAPVSTTYRYAALLKEMGFLSDDGQGRYCIAPTLLRVAAAGREAIRYPELAKAEVASLAARTGETVLLIQPVGGNGVCIDKVESPHAMRIAYELGAAFPLHRGAAPKVLLAFQSDAERERYLQQLRAEARGQAVAQLRKELDQIRADDVGYSSAEITSGLWAVAVPIRQADKVVLALSVAGPAFRIGPRARASIERDVRATAARISALLSELGDSA
ncbi:Kip operon repressor protein (plasmid) [Variovorax sp. SRS16]|uniref:IclR family transcriptional regulator n=1 Tax=Variovorax sp. SRS16 TaxID=282217 RepID=UPI0013178F8E|nr:IclR family transcriptional regulator [Variovorax sp. SRS16]VTU46568.1 Kip operon repressor protein [Variovorax sp. SRS16]